MVCKFASGPADPVYLVDVWTLQLLPDEAAGNNKMFEVPQGQEYQVLWIYVEFTTVAGGAARQLEIDVLDNTGDIIGQIRPGVTQAASNTYYYMFAPSLADLTAIRDTDYLMTPFPPTIFLPGYYQIRVFDNNNVDNTDTINVQMMVASRNQ